MRGHARPDQSPITGQHPRARIPAAVPRWANPRCQRKEPQRPRNHQPRPLREIDANRDGQNPPVCSAARREHHTPAVGGNPDAAKPPISPSYGRRPLSIMNSPAPGGGSTALPWFQSVDADRAIPIGGLDECRKPLNVIEAGGQAHRRAQRPAAGNWIVTSVLLRGWWPRYRGRVARAGASSRRRHGRPPAARRRLRSAR